MDNIADLFKKNVRAAMTLKRMTGGQTAAKAGMPQSQLSDYLSPNSTTVPTLTKAARIAEALEVPLSELLKTEPVIAPAAHDFEDCLERIVIAARAGNAAGGGTNLIDLDSLVAAKREIIDYILPLNEGEVSRIAAALPRGKSPQRTKRSL